MSRTIFVVYKFNNHAPPTGLRAYATLDEAQNFAFKYHANYKDPLGIMIVKLEECAEEKLVDH